MPPIFSRNDRPTEIEQRLSAIDREAGSLLVRADEQVRESSEALQYERASVGEFETQQFSQALAKARALLAEAFHLRQLLDDQIPDTDEQREQWGTRIIELSNAALAVLAEQGAAFDRLRAIGRDLPARIAALRTQLTELEERAARAVAIQERLAAEYDPGVVAHAQDLEGQAIGLLTIAGRALEASARRLGTAVQDKAPETLEAASAALGRAGRLLDALDSFEGDLVAAQLDLAALLERAQAVLGEARAAFGSDPQHADAIGQLAAAVASSSPGRASRDPFGALEKLRALVDRAEAPLRAIRDARHRADAARAALPGQLKQASDYIQWVEDFAASRRTTLSSQARTRLSEAARHVNAAANEPDPIAALTAAQRASQLATEAWTIAHDDVARQQQPAIPTARAPGSSDGKTAAIAVGAALGGILLGSFGRGWGRGGIDLGDLFD